MYQLDNSDSKAFRRGKDLVMSKSSRFLPLLLEFIFIETGFCPLLVAFDVFLFGLEVFEILVELDSALQLVSSVDSDMLVSLDRTSSSIIRKIVHETHVSKPSEKLSWKI